MADTPQVSITINGVSHSVDAGQLLIAAAESVGEYIPRFCYHDKLDPVGMCRMCLVEVEGPRGTMLVPSCTTSVSDDMVVDTESEVVKRAQEGILEFLLLNHPLDCPICDKGGECPLQDQAYAFGSGESRFIEEKRTYLKPLPISDLVLLDRERCVICDRCVRVADDIAGDPLITFTERGGAVQIQTFPNEPFSSYFSGNTVQLCPVGALTSVDYRFKARPWDLKHQRSVSLVDPIHSSVDVQTTRGKIVRVYGVENNAINEGWLSDKDRFSFAFLHADTRVTTPLVKKDGQFEEATWSEAFDLVASRLGSYKGAEVGAIGGAHNTNEEAFTLGKFMRTVIGSAHIDAQLGDSLSPHFAAAVTPRATINDLDSAATILVWGPDLKESLPVLFLRVRKAVRNGAKLIVVNPIRTGLDSIATHSVMYRAGTGPDVLRKLSALDGEYADIRATLDEGPVVALVGRTSMAEDPLLPEAVAGFARSLSDATIMPLLTQGNVFGALDMGLAPSLLPGRVSLGSEVGVETLETAWGPLPDFAGYSTAEMLDAAANGDLPALILVGADPVRDSGDPVTATQALQTAEFVVAVDAFITDSSALADVILPAAVWGEVDGTVTNCEGRVQRIRPSLEPSGRSLATTMILDDLAHRMGVALGASTVEAVSKEISAVAPVYGGITMDYLTFEGDPDGVLVPLDDAEQPLGFIPTESTVPVVTGEFTMHLERALYDDGTWVRNAPILRELVRPAVAKLHPGDASRRAISNGDLIIIGGVVEIPAAIDDTVPRGTIVIPANRAETADLVVSGTVTVDALRGDA